MTISEADALAAHKAIHEGKDEVKLESGEKLAVTKGKNGCKAVKFPKFQAMEQNTSKSSAWAKKAKEGVKITWFLSGPSPATWGRVVDGKIDAVGKAIAAMPAKAAAKAAARSAGAKAEAKAEAKAAAKKRPEGKAKAKAAARATAKAEAKSAAEKKRKEPEKETAPEMAEAPEKKLKTESPGPSSATSATSEDPLVLEPLFAGMGHGSTWLKVLKPVMEDLSAAPSFIGPARDKRIVPVRELTFQALKPNPPSGWRVVSFGQSPYPRIESATGIAHFDNNLKSWDSGAFGSVTTMRCIMKAALMNKFKIPKSTKVPELRRLLKTKGIVSPDEWFQAILTQGVLLMNAACTIRPAEGQRAGEVVQEHLLFWQPVIAEVVKAILAECQESKRPIIFAWWGSESLKTKKVLDKTAFCKFPSVKIRHIEHKNPAAMADAFCDDPNIFAGINKAIKELALGDPIEWLPDSSWKATLGSSSQAEEMGAFMQETQELHKMYLERLKDGLDTRSDDLDGIVGIMSKPLVDLPDACKPLALTKAGEASQKFASKMSRKSLSLDEAGALHLYTTNYLYKALNAALRHADRKKALDYFLYLRLFLSALEKLPRTEKELYRGVALDLQHQYKVGSTVTWWAVSSSTPDLGVATSFSGSKTCTLFIISSLRSVGIRDFSQYKSEEEYILAPGTQFEVTKVLRKGSKVEIHMKELDQPRKVQ